MQKSLLLGFFLLLFVPAAFGKKAKIVEGSLAGIKGVKRMNVLFSYEGMTVGAKAHIPEEEFIEKKKEELNEKEKGKGQTWATAWKNDKTRRYEPSFKTMFNKDSKVHLGKFPTEKYTLIFVTQNLEGGFNVGVMRHNAEMTGEAWIVETANMSNVLCKIKVENVQGRGGIGADFDSGERIRGAYLAAANMIKKLIVKKIS